MIADLLQSIQHQSYDQSLITTFVMAAGGIGGAYFSAKASICFTSDLREDLFAKVQEFSFKNIDTYSTGSLVTRLTNDIQQIQNVIMMGCA